MRYPAPIDPNLAASLIKQGEVVALPTETVFGLAGDIFDEKAIRQIFEVKGRPLIDPLIVHCLDLDQVSLCTAAPLESFKALAEAFWPGPLTVVLPKRECISDLITAQLPGVALRIPAQNEFREVLRLVGNPLAAPSANPFGYISPTRWNHVRDSFGGRIPVVNGAPTKHGIESSVLSLMNPQNPRLLRPGPITREQLEDVLKCPVEQPNQQEANSRGSQEAPGMLHKHYSPTTKLVPFEEQTTVASDKESALVLLRRPRSPEGFPTGSKQTFWLSESGDLEEVARNLFHLLRKLDDGRWKQIFVELPPPEGIGVALRDRILRAR